MTRKVVVFCVWVCKIAESNNKEFLCITHTVEHNYISPSSTVGIQPHVSALHVDHIQVHLTYRSAVQDVWGVLFRVLGVGREETRSRCFSSGYHDLGLL